MKRDYKLFINDLRESVELIEKYMKGVSEKKFKKSTMLQDAVIRRIEIIGEASKGIPWSVKKVNPQVPWKKLEDYRDFIIHSYFEASLHRIWRVAKKDMPELKQNIKKIKLL